MNYIKLIFYIVQLITLNSCGQNCNELPNFYKSYDEAKTLVLNTSFKYTDDCDVSESSFITSADYYSCDGLVGYFLIGMNGKKYIFQNMPFEVWEDFKNTESKGKFYNREIRGRYLLKLK